MRRSSAARLLRSGGRAAPDAMRRIGLAFLLAGGLAALAGTVVPDPDRSDHPALMALGAVCLGLALILALWRRPPASALSWLPTLGVVLVAVAVAVARPLASTPTYCLLPVLASAYFGSPRRLLFDLGLCAATLAVALAVWVEPGARVAIFIGTMIPAVGVAIVVAALKQRLDAHVDGLRSLADTDPLTGLLNHGAFGAELERALEHGRATGRGATLLMLDIDHFKQVNDAFGHQEGDRMLRLVGDLLSAHKRRGDLLGRVGGEEFALLLPEAGARSARLVAERVLGALRTATARTPAALTLSIGIAEQGIGTDTPDTLVYAADRALYVAKDRGRDRAVDIADAGPAGHRSLAAGAASRVSTGTPLAWSARNESFEVFSSSRLTR